MKLWTVFVHALLLVASALTLLPLWWMVAASFMPPGEASAVPLRLWPSVPTLEHYQALFARLDIGRHVAISAGLAIVTTAIALTVNTLAGYAFAKLPFPGRDRIFRGLLGALVIPGQVAMLPLFLLMRAFGWIDSWIAVIVPGMASVFGIFLVRQYAAGLPDGVLDAARMDGAGELRVFRSIALPLCAPILVTLGLVTFMGAWNDFLWPLIVLADDDRYTLPVALANLVGEHVQDTELVMAGAVLTVLPVIVLFLVLQRWYVAGITSGGVKG
ncbi:MAG TPA: carbohydrate ABC transporter permease [Candidatus Binatia bacterium]|jgi:multiple sugar transport system permease protein|nr:carbohydrate ABC transporter permease [Candidatus Binatia bacterium]